MSTPVLPWHAFEGKGWPATAGDERQFVEAMWSHSGGPAGGVGRTELTVVLVALRSGSTLEQLIDGLPALEVDVALASYLALEDARDESAEAVGRVLAEPWSAPDEDWDQASRLLPILQTQLRRGRKRVVTKRRDDAQERIVALRAASERYEDQLRDVTPRSRRAIAVGRRLFDAHEPGLWADPYFLPLRVGELMPVRVASLLGEDPGVLEPQGAVRR